MWNIKRKIATAIRVIRLFRNWPSIILTYLGLLRDAQLVFALRNGIKYVTASGNVGERIFTFFEIWLDRVYTPSGDEIKPGFTVVDIGAHIGVFTIFAASHSDSVRVVSYEPHPDNFRLLMKNIELNHLKNVEPFQSAVAGASGRRQLFVSPESVAHSLVDPQENYIEVDCVTLEDVLDNVGKCDFLKIDCEGAEYEIIFNTPSSCLNKVGRVSMEVDNPTSFKQQSRNYSVYDLKTYLEQAGFEVALDESSNTPYAYLYATRQP